MIEPSPNVKAVVSANVYVRPFGDDLVLLDFAEGEYFGLDPIGAEVWRALESGRTLADVAGALVERYDIEPDRALADVVSLVRDLTDKRLLSLESR